MATQNGKDPSPGVREKVVQEIVATERTFVASLKLVIEVYIEPLRSKAILTKDEISGIFSNWEMLVRPQL